VGKCVVWCGYVVCGVGVCVLWVSLWYVVWVCGVWCECVVCGVGECLVCDLSECMVSDCGCGALGVGRAHGSRVLTDLVTERDKEERLMWSLFPALTCVVFHLKLCGVGVWCVV